MPSDKQIVIAHFRGLNLKPGERLESAIVIVWVSPEQEYYVDRRNVQAMVDLINKTVNPVSSAMYTVIAGYLQRFNFYRKKHDTEASTSEIDMAARQAMGLGVNWYRMNKRIISCLNFPRNKRQKIFWQELLLKQEYLAAKKFIDDTYRRDSKYTASCTETSEIFVGSKKVQEEQPDRETYLYNSQEYLREEGAFLYALPQLYAKEITEGKKIYIVYPHGASPAIKATLDLIQQRYPDVMHWLCVDLKQRNLEKFDLPQYLACNPQCGCSRNVEKLMQAKDKHSDKKGVDFGFSQGEPTPQALSTWLSFVAEKKSQVDEEWLRVMRESATIIAGGQSPPKGAVLSSWGSFFVRAKELGNLSDSSSSASSSSSTPSSEDEGEAGCSFSSAPIEPQSK